MSASINRRHFLKATAAGMAGAAFLGNQEWVEGAKAIAAEPVRVAVIGIGGPGKDGGPNGRGWENVQEMCEEAGDGVRIVGLCDVDSARVVDVRRMFPQAFFTDDFRRIMDRKDVEAVLVATPDHTHAVIAAAAMRAGKHVYCEKPLAHDVHEIRTMIDLAQQHHTVTQMGTQIHSWDNYRRVVEIIKAGTIGSINRVKVWVTDLPRPGQLGRTGATPPSSLNYDLWLGPAPYRPYDESHLHFVWRYWWDFGGGVLADMACHYIDLAHWALDLSRPVKVSATDAHIDYVGDNFVPSRMQVELHYPARQSQPPVHLTWFHGVQGPDLNGRVTYPDFENGVLFEGEKGSLLARYNRWRLLPADRFTGFRPPTPTIPASFGHHREWLQAIRTGGTTTCNFGYSGPLAETVLLGNVAYRTGATLEYDGATGRLTNNVPAAEQYLKRPYRQGWTL